MASLCVDRRVVTLSLDGDAIAFHEEGERIGTMPVAPLERIYPRGDVRLFSGLLGRLGSYGIGVVVLSGRKGQQTMLLPRPHNDARIRVAHGGKRAAPGPLARSRKISAQPDLVAEIGIARPEIDLPCRTATDALSRMSPATSCTN
jgi:CRISP-associated protein Cas1